MVNEDFPRDISPRAHIAPFRDMDGRGASGDRRKQWADRERGSRPAFKSPLRGSLENARQPSREGIEGGGIEQEVGHAQSGTRMSTASIPYRMAGGNLGIAAEYDQIGLPRKFKLSGRHR